ncbi:MAG: N-acetylmuramoyl-L-alanine amidase, partial [Thermoguttaceae bacterium]|nr:N-acetylmuramoyl-L-alanine amidase [Thermoguttaceae bacterium]
MSPKIQTLKDFGDGWWVDEDHRLSCSKSSTYLQQPSVIVLHWTAAPYKGLAENLARIKRWAANNNEKQSTHFSILRDGSIYQLVPTTRAAWHAGESEWTRADGVHLPISKSAKSVNRYSLGIDFDLVGPVTRYPDGRWVDCYGGTYSGPQPEYSDQTRKWYEPVQLAQLVSCRMLLDLLMSRFKVQLHDVVGHVDVSPGRTIDPGPFITQAALGLV